MRGRIAAVTLVAVMVAVMVVASGVMAGSAGSESSLSGQSADVSDARFKGEPVAQTVQADRGGAGTSDASDGCCVGIRGNIDGDAEDLINISDMTYLVAYLFSDGDAPPCFEEGDVSAEGSINILDMTYLVAYLFSGGPAPVACPTICPPTVTDYDGNVYQTVLIGDQCWMMENLKVTHYRNGDPIPKVTDGSAWCGLSSDAYCDYDDDSSHVDIYGRLYNWYAVDDSRNIAPAGWHVASDDEWKQLEMHLGMSQAEADALAWRGTDEGGKLKESGTTHWVTPNEGATNETGFTALPGGYRNLYGGFLDVGIVANFWSTTEFGTCGAWSRFLSYDLSQVYRYYCDIRSGCSVRCVQD